MKKFIVLSSLLVLGSSLASYADTPADPREFRPYKLEVSETLSRALMESVKFQKEETVRLPKTGPFGPCTKKKMTWSSDPVFTGESGKKRTITCLEGNSCFYKMSRPSCTVTLSDVVGQVASDFVSVTE